MQNLVPEIWTDVKLMLRFHVLISVIFFGLLYICFISLRVMLSTLLEMKTLHPWTQQSTWRRFLQVSVLLTHCDDLCTYLWLHSGGCLCFWQNASIVCAHVNVYWQLAPCYAPVLFLPALGLNNTERKASLLWRRFARHCNSLFLLFKKTSPTMYSFVTAGRWRHLLIHTNTELVIDFVGSVKESSGTAAR